MGKLGDDWAYVGWGRDDIRRGWRPDLDLPNNETKSELTPILYRRNVWDVKSSGQAWLNNVTEIDLTKEDGPGIHEPKG